MESDELSLRRRTAKCGCTESGPGATCAPGQQLFSALRVSYARAQGAHPSDDAAWSPYEGLRLAYYQHLGERALPHVPAEVAALRESLMLQLYNTDLETLDDCRRVADHLLRSLRPDLFPPGEEPPV